MTTPTLEGGAPGSLLDEHIEPFLKHLRSAGYAERTLRKKRTVAKAFARWARRKQIVGGDEKVCHFGGQKAPVEWLRRGWRLAQECDR
jgi:hypothetical protein